jgi:hypothetical protein
MAADARRDDATSEARADRNRFSRLAHECANAVRAALESARGDSPAAIARRRALLSTLDAWCDGDISVATALARVASISGRRS